MTALTKPPGRCVTFYSYKGGTGRSMALANVAWILAATGRRVLTIDWDFEAPGLHRYFRPFLKDPELSATPGLIDMLWEFVDAAMAEPEQWDEIGGPTALADPSRYAVALEFPLAGEGQIHFLSAGQQIASYAGRVRDFDWRAFYERLNGKEFLDALAARMREHYDVVLIDSRTGVADTAGICTVQFPDEVVMCFTPNRQSVLGVQAVGRSIRRQRPEVRLVPVAMRVEKGADGLKHSRQFFRDALDDVQPHRGDPSGTEAYWGAAEVQHYPDYSLEETLAVFRDLPRQRSSLLADMEWLAGEILETSPIPMPPMDASVRAKFLRRFALRDPRSAELAEVMDGEPLRALKYLQEWSAEALGSHSTELAWGGELVKALLRCTTRLRDTGAREEVLIGAQEAMHLARRLADLAPEEFRASAARAAIGLGTALIGLGRREEALAAAKEAVDAYRELAARDPDTFRGDLAGSLNNLSTCLADLGRREEALAAVTAAVEIHRALAEARPDALRPDLAMSLNNQSLRLAALGRREEALAAITAAVEIRRALAEARPDAFRPDLAASLNNQSTALADLGRREEALKAITAAVEIRRTLAEARPDAFRPDLASSLNNQSTALAALGRHEGALAVGAEAVEIYRALVQVRPDAFAQNCAVSLYARGLILRDADRPADAAAGFAEGMAVLLPLFRRWPQAVAELMAALAAGYREAAERAGMEPDLPMLTEVVAILASLEAPAAT